MVLFLSKRSDAVIAEKYISSGLSMGNYMDLMVPFGEQPGIKHVLKRWELLEAEYANRGYRTILLRDFHSAVRGTSIDHLVRNLRGPQEEAILHAPFYREHFLGKVDPFAKGEVIAMDSGFKGCVDQYWLVSPNDALNE